ncbi:MAG: response regulator receiver protein [Pedosphaera sp.]|nr:response regulator receiver protein [Pedosphaera sp.]
MKARHPSFLVVEDNEDDQYFILHALQKSWPHPIHSVSSGEEAILYLNGKGKYADRKEFPYPTTIMTDASMDDSLKLLENLKKNELWQVIPTIVLSGSHDPVDIKKVYALGASCYLLKPCDNDKLTALMGKLVDFWNECEVPEIDLSGKQLDTAGEGNSGAGAKRQ